MPFGYSDTFDVLAPSPWQKPVCDDDKKRAYGVALASEPEPFRAACILFPEDTGKAAWVSQNWITDPVVVAARDESKAVATEQALLDKDQFAAKLLAISDEKGPDNRFHLHDLKDRTAVLKLYAEVRGFIGSGNQPLNNNQINFLTLKVVKPDEKETKVIDSIASIEDKNLNLNPVPITLKLVKAS